jgi:hypothetical protein
MSNAQDRLAGIEYAGLGGISHECQDAVLRLVQYGDQITRARILSCSGSHCLLLTVNVGDDLIAVKSGFGSGYGGTGPGTFSYVLNVLREHGVQIDEYDVPSDLIDRLDESALTVADLDMIEHARPVRPSRWYDYISREQWESRENGTLWREFPLIIPLAAVDGRLIDLAMSFREHPDHALLNGYRRLEDIIRRRIGSEDHSTKLFSQAFLGPSSKLTWDGIDTGEQQGRAQLFTGAYMAHRNPRAHRELNDHPERQLSEFLLLNHLYQLESESVERPLSDAE